jgi:hypothetical protein
MASWSFVHDFSKNLGSVSTRCLNGSILAGRFFWELIFSAASPRRSGEKAATARVSRGRKEKDDI